MATCHGVLNMSETVMEKMYGSGRKVKVTITEDGHVIVENPLSADIVFNMTIGGQNMVDFESTGQDYIAVHATCDTQGVMAELSRLNDAWWSKACRPAIRLLPVSMSEKAQHFLLELRKGGTERFTVLGLLPIKPDKPA